MSTTRPEFGASRSQSARVAVWALEIAGHKASRACSRLVLGLCLPLAGCSLLIDADALSEEQRPLNQTGNVDASAGSAAKLASGGTGPTRGGAFNLGNLGGSQGGNSAGAGGGSEPSLGGGAGFAGMPEQAGAAGSAGAAGTGSAGAGGTNPTVPKTYTYTAKQMLHIVGYEESEAWAASVLPTSKPGFLAYGPSPYPTNWGTGEATVTFYLMVDDNERDDKILATINLVDVALGVTLLSKDISRKDFVEANKYQAFSLPRVSLAGRHGHGMDSQVYFHNAGYVRFQKVVVTLK